MTDTAACLLRYLEELLSRSDASRPAWNQEVVRNGKPNRWNYIDGLMITAVLELYAITGEERWLSFADGFVGAFVTEKGEILGLDPTEQNLDLICPARNLLPLYRLTRRERYRLAADRMFRQLTAMPRTREGSFWHKGIYPWQVWLDGLYMAMPFYMAYDRAFCAMAHYRDIYDQFIRVAAHMRDPVTGLYYHGWDESRQMPWADPDTGCSPSFWLRSLGWLAMALCDTLEAMDERLYYEYRMLQRLLRELMEALRPWQRPDGRFCQVVNYPDERGNYPETSGTAMLAYAALKAVRLGLLPARFRDLGKRAFDGVVRTELTLSADGGLTLGGTCLMAGLGGPKGRDGTRAYYYSEPVVENEGKGVAPLMLALTEVLRFESSSSNGGA